MKKIASALISVLLLLSFAGCSNGFMSDKDIKNLSQKPTGTIKFSYLDGGEEKEIVLNFELFYENAPITVTNFVKLAKDGFYTDMYVPGIFTESGNTKIEVAGKVKYDDPETEADESKNFTTKPLDYTIKGEFSENGWEGNEVSHLPLTMSMLRDAEKSDSADYKFMINFDDMSESMDGKYAAFGRITSNDSQFLGILLDLVQDYNTGTLKIVEIIVNTHGEDLGNPKTIKK